MRATGSAIAVVKIEGITWWAKRPIAGTSRACEVISSPRRTTLRVPSSKTQSIAATQPRVAPYLSVCAPAAFVDAMPPTVQ
jgi:hypothetical protein